jgi:methionine biosynthesis protein MetW
MPGPIDAATLRAARADAYESSRPEVRALVPPRTRRILDLGCASGAVGAALKAREDVEVVGVERDAAYAADARRRLDRVVEADVEGFAARAGELGRFDCLIAADVLEHLVDPWRALRDYAGLLEPGCRAVVSLPNVASWQTYWALARGSWPRRPEGIFDATHLRWFTLKDAWELCEQAGLEVEAVHRISWPGRGRRVLPPPLRTLTTFQHVVAARRRS